MRKPEPPTPSPSTTHEPRAMDEASILPPEPLPEPPALPAAERGRDILEELRDSFEIR